MDEIAKTVRENPDINQTLAILTQQDNSVLTSVDSTGGNLLFIAAQRPSDQEGRQIIEYLIETRGVCRADTEDYNGQTALFFAARDGHTQCVRYLIQKGCNPHHVDSAGQTALFYASRDGREDVVNLLLEEFDLDVNTTDRVGQSALFYAAREGHRKIVERMLEHGANPSIRDWQKKCAHAYAQRRGHLDLAAYLKSVSTETRALGGEYGISNRAKKRSSSGNPSDARSRYLLQYVVHLPSGDIWLFAHVNKIKEFETHFPSLAAWSQISQNLILPTDAFRMEWAKEALQIVHIVSNYQDGWLFTKPVDTKAWNCPDYYDVVKQPRDLTMLKRKLRGLKYFSVHTFLTDLDLMFANCFLYNSETTYVHIAGQKVQAFCNSLLEERNFHQWVVKEEQLISYLKENGILPIQIGKEAEAANDSQSRSQATQEPTSSNEGKAATTTTDDDHDGTHSSQVLGSQNAADNVDTMVNDGQGTQDHFDMTGDDDDDIAREGQETYNRQVVDVSFSDASQRHLSEATQVVGHADGKSSNNSYDTVNGTRAVQLDGSTTGQEHEIIMGELTSPPDMTDTNITSPPAAATKQEKNDVVVAAEANKHVLNHGYDIDVIAMSDDSVMEDKNNFIDR